MGTKSGIFNSGFIEIVIFYLVFRYELYALAHFQASSNTVVSKP